MLRRLSLAFPWLFLALVVGLIVWDQTRQRSPEGHARVSRDPVCGMDVRTGASHYALHGDRPFWFCTSICRDEFQAAPTRFLEPGDASGSHRMHGVPAWMAQAAVAILLVLSFGLFEGLDAWRARRRDPAAAGSSMDARLDLTGASWVRRALRLPWLVPGARLVMAFLFLLVVAAGLFGNQNPAMNLAPLLTWTVWWAGLIFLILYAGKLWCTVCPWDALATWMERLRFSGARTGGFGLGLKWPRALRNIWFAVVFFVALTWIELGMGITMIPRATAAVALGMLGLAVVSAFVFERKSFCRYGCLVGRVSGLYALFAPVELRSNRADACAGCRTMDCYRGNPNGDGCPTFEFPKVMKSSTYCILCTECMKTCPHDNIAVRLRPWGADLAHEGKPRVDEAFLSVILLALTGFHGLTMTPSWPAWVSATRAALGLPEWGAFTLLMGAAMAVPALLYAALTWMASLWSAPHRPGTLFVRYAYALLPIALFYHLAHNAEHFLMEGPKVLALASDPFGWGWNLFGTARWTIPPLITLEGLWGIQILMVLVGHVYSLWISSRTTRRLIPNRRAAFLSQLPMLAAMVLFSVFSLWLLRQPMEMRSAM